MIMREDGKREFQFNKVGTDEVVSVWASDYTTAQLMLLDELFTFEVAYYGDRYGNKPSIVSTISGTIMVFPVPEGEEWEVLENE